MVVSACTTSSGDGDAGAATFGADTAAPGTSSTGTTSAEATSEPSADSGTGAHADTGDTTVDSSGGDPGLVQPGDLAYVGSFRVPTGSFGSDENAIFDYADDGLAYAPATDTLFVKGHTYGQLVAEISIPEAVAGPLDGLPVAEVVQPFADITEGHLDDENIGNGMVLGGLMVDDDRLVGAAWAYYDAAAQQTRSHFTSSLDLGQQGDFAGLFTVGEVFPAKVGGYMAHVPPVWQDALGGPAITGHCCTSIISNQSTGPAAFVFDPAQLGVMDPTPATALVYYDLEHPTLGTWDNTQSPNPRYNMSSLVTGALFVPDTRSLLFFGRTGLGVACYGEGTYDPSLAGMPTEDGSQWCYDPANSYKGTHAYPYGTYVWAYDVDDLAAVRSGARDPWSVEPYADWELELPIETGDASINGVAYDDASGRLFIAQAHADEARPVLHVYRFAP